MKYGSLHWSYILPQIPQLLCLSQQKPSQIIHPLIFSRSSTVVKLINFVNCGWSFQPLDILLPKWEVTLKAHLLHICMIYGAGKIFKLYAELLIIFMETNKQQTNKTWLWQRLVSHSPTLYTFPPRQTAK